MTAPPASYFSYLRSLSVVKCKIHFLFPKIYSVQQWLFWNPSYTIWATKINLKMFVLQSLCLLGRALWYAWTAAPQVRHPSQWRHNGRDSVLNHQPHDCLLNRLFRRRSKKTSKLRVTGLCEGNSLGTGEFPAQRDSNAENVSIWWRHHWYMNRIDTCFFFQ